MRTRQVWGRIPLQLTLDDLRGMLGPEGVRMKVRELQRMHKRMVARAEQTIEDAIAGAASTHDVSVPGA